MLSATIAEPVMKPACRVTIASPLTRAPQVTGITIVGLGSRTDHQPVQRIDPGNAA